MKGWNPIGNSTVNSLNGTNSFGNKEVSNEYK